MGVCFWLPACRRACQFVFSFWLVFVLRPFDFRASACLHACLTGCYSLRHSILSGLRVDVCTGLGYFMVLKFSRHCAVGVLIVFTVLRVFLLAGLLARSGSRALARFFFFFFYRGEQSGNPHTGYLEIISRRQ
jgi:hypothetical protein